MAKEFDYLENEALRFGAGVPADTKWRNLSKEQRQGFDNYMRTKIRRDPSVYSADSRAHKYLKDYDQGAFDSMRQQELNSSVNPGAMWDDFGGTADNPVESDFNNDEGNYQPDKSEDTRHREDQREDLRDDDGEETNPEEAAEEPGLSTEPKLGAEAKPNGESGMSTNAATGAPEAAGEEAANLAKGLGNASKVAEGADALGGAATTAGAAGGGAAAAAGALETAAAADAGFSAVPIMAAVAIVVGFFLLIGLFTAVSWGNPDSAKAKTPDEIPTVICLDPGHPSSTSGAPGEKEINFQMATELKPALEAKGYTVFMTKKSVNENVDNKERAYKCATAGGKYMLALHADDTGNATDFPYLIYANSKRSISAQSKKDAAAVGKGLIDTLSSAGYIGSELKGKANCEENTCTAAQDLGVFVGGDQKNLSVDIIEMIHLTNSHSWLDNSAHRAKYIEGLVAGITAAYPPTSGNGAKLNNVPHFFQGNDPITGKRPSWADKVYGCGSTYARGGCGPTSIAMVVSYFTGTNHYPDEIGDIAYKHGLRPCSGGTDWKAPIKIPEMFGLKAKVIANKDSELKKYLGQGALIIQLHHAPDFFTHNGHFIVLTGVTSDGKYNVNDPNGGNYPRTKVATSSEVLGGSNLMSWAVWK